uniref:TSC22 domain family protein 1-like n=1 Tax=Rhabditophanes sp. KR3021 TaxID=114890 RepID=A0AC35TNN0_9BILA
MTSQYLSTLQAPKSNYHESILHQRRHSLVPEGQRSPTPQYRCNGSQYSPNSSYAKLTRTNTAEALLTTANSLICPINKSAVYNPTFYSNSQNSIRTTNPYHPLLFSSSNPSGSNTTLVAIDHKIERAMDLVKTHLMFAVREEVDSLRSRIQELESIAKKLEIENNFLREHISRDVLQQINNQLLNTN